MPRRQELRAASVVKRLNSRYDSADVFLTGESYACLSFPHINPWP